jgi:hypothetical protein
MIFGINPLQMRRMAVVGGIVAVVLLAFGIPVGLSHGTFRGSSDMVRLVTFAVAIGAILPVVVGLAGMLRLRIDSQQIDQMIGPWVVARRPTSELRRAVLRGRLFPVRLCFADGSRFALLALHVAEVPRLAAALQTVAPQAVIE